MEIIEVKSEEYGRMFGNYIAVYNSPEFNYLNKGKTEEVKYFLFISGKVRLGLIAGINKNLLISPSPHLLVDLHAQKLVSDRK